MLLIVLVHVVALLIGSIPVGYLVGKVRGVDVRLHGSGNIGATNIGRTLGKAAGVVTLCGDVAKGMAAVLLVHLPLLANLSAEQISACRATLGLCAIIGHCFSPFLRFKGGKGVATGLGVFLLLAPVETTIATCVFALVLKVSGYVSLGSISSVLVLTLLLALEQFSRANPSLMLAGLITALIIVGRHRANIQRLLSQTEQKFSFKRAN